jgi:MFS family permease
MTLINFVNYVDRQVIFPLFPLLRKDFGLNYAHLGGLATAFTVVLSVGSLPLGILADRTSRRAVISGGVVVWSLATFCSGLATSFRALLTARSAVGIGEAAYTPAGTAVISGTFPRTLRARVQGCFDMGMFAGGATGIVLGGVLAQYFGWRFSFWLVGGPGLLLAFAARGLKEPPRLASKVRVPVNRLLRVPAYVMILVSGWFASFAGYAYIAWTPALVQEHKGFTPSEAGVALGVASVVCGLSGIATGAALADRLAQRISWGRIAIVPVGFLLSAPFIMAALHTDSKPLFITFFGAGVYFLSWYHGPVTATIHDLTPETAHATAYGLYTFFVNLFAMAIAPLVVGAIADRYGLLRAMQAAIAAQVTGGISFISVALLIDRYGLAHSALTGYATVETASELPVADANWS